MKNKVNLEAYFLGPKAENKKFYLDLLERCLDNHCNWRKAFGHHDSEPFISEEDKKRKDFISSQNRIESTIQVLNEKLKLNQPFFSPRYIGHMNWEVMAAPIIASFTAALFNPNNVAYAGSTGTTELEIEVGQDFIELFGMDKKKAWGHICTGGTIANMEALWIARNMKKVPLILKKLANNYHFNEILIPYGNDKKNLLDISDDNLVKAFNPEEIIELKEIVFDHILKQRKNNTNNVTATSNDFKDQLDDEFVQMSAQHTGINNDDGLVFLPSTKHYSLKKSMDLLGIGYENIRYVPVNDEFKMDMNELEKLIRKESKDHKILAVIAVMGSTEESAVDDLHKILELRDKLKKELKIGFHVHADAAYGGYVRTLMLDENGQFMSKEELDKYLKEFGIIGDKEVGGKKVREQASWPTENVFNAFKALEKADTITVDPHKLGYVLYPAGGFVMRDKRMREFIQVFAPYVFPKPKPGEPDILIGAYILEGSKPGAAAAAVWAANRILPLNITGYGKLIGETIDGAQALYYGLANHGNFVLKNGKKINVIPLTKPDLNIVNYFFNVEGNNDLSIINALTEYITSKILGPDPEPGETILEKTFIATSTELDIHEYGDTPYHFLKNHIDISEKEWRKNQKLTIVRSVIMSPYLTPDYVDENYVELFIQYLENELKENSDEIIKIINHY
jgi:glutamate/tyrosine decarboxylase-like PLP-dependent enzyme